MSSSRLSGRVISSLLQIARTLPFGTVPQLHVHRGGGGGGRGWREGGGALVI